MQDFTDFETGLVAKSFQQSPYISKGSILSLGIRRW